MRLPEITALQFVVLSFLFEGEKTGRQLRREVAQWGGPDKPAAFSQLMTRMRRAAYIDARRHESGDPGQDATHRVYRVTDLGVVVWQAARRFYHQSDPPPPDLEPVETLAIEFADRPPKRREALIREKFVKVMMKAARRSRK